MADLVDLTTDATAPAEPILIGESPVQGYSLANNVGLHHSAFAHLSLISLGLAQNV